MQKLGKYKKGIVGVNPVRGEGKIALVNVGSERKPSHKGGVHERNQIYNSVA